MIHHSTGPAGITSQELPEWAVPRVGRQLLDALRIVDGVSSPVPLGRVSDQWRPIILSSCAPGMQAHYAPCLNASVPGLDNLLLGEELIYPGALFVDHASVRFSGHPYMCLTATLSSFEVNTLLMSFLKSTLRSHCAILSLQELESLCSW